MQAHTIATRINDDHWACDILARTVRGLADAPFGQPFEFSTSLVDSTLEALRVLEPRVSDREQRYTLRKTRSLLETAVKHGQVAS
jgi:hypothetical protein